MIDAIDNQAPLAHQLSALERTGAVVAGALVGGGIGATAGALVSHTVDTGQLLVSESGPYYLAESPSRVVEAMFHDALAKVGVSTPNDAPRLLKIEVLRFEFTMASERGDFSVKARACVLWRARVHEGDRLLSDQVVLQNGDFDGGLGLTASEVNDFVETTLSTAVEKTLVAANISTGALAEKPRPVA